MKNINTFVLKPIIKRPVVFFVILIFDLNMSGKYLKVAEDIQSYAMVHINNFRWDVLVYDRRALREKLLSQP